MEVHFRGVHMVKLRLSTKAAVLGLAVLTAASCFRVQIVEKCQDAEPFFRRAYREIGRLEAADPHRHGRAHELCVLVLDRQAGDLVRVEIPLWLAKACLDMGVEVSQRERSLDFEERYGVDWRKFRHLDRFGRGLLVSVDDEQSQVLVWLR
jgi:hypothetical protein